MSLSSAIFTAGLLGAASFGMGMLPLVVTFSKSTLASLTTYGAGLLLGAALGVVIPEGVSGIISSNAPRSALALSLLSGFAFMLVVERQLSSHAPTFLEGNNHAPLPTVEFDVELGDLERTEGVAQDALARSTAHTGAVNAELQQRAYPLTFGLAVHAFVDGIAMGSAALSASGTNENSAQSRVFVAVFLALVVHKAPTALALTTTLLSTSLPVAECRRHLAIFSSMTPVATLLSYAVLSFFGGRSGGGWESVALLFSGGTFLYVATVLQPTLAHAHEEGAESDRRKLLTMLAGIATPYLITVLLPDSHEHST